MVGVLGRTAVKREIEVCAGVPALVAVLGKPGSIVCATSGFVDRFDVTEGEFPMCMSEVDLITTGQADRLTARFDGVEASLPTVGDKPGRRMAQLVVPSERDAADDAADSP